MNDFDFGAGTITHIEIGPRIGIDIEIATCTSERYRSCLDLQPSCKFDAAHLRSEVNRTRGYNLGDTSEQKCWNQT